MIFNIPYLAVVCFLWLAAAIGYAFIKKQRADRSQVLELGTLDNFLTSNENVLPHKDKKRELRQPVIEQPLEESTFSEGVDAVMFSVGSCTQGGHIDTFKNGKHRFFVGNIPAVLYFDNGKPYIDVELYTPPNEPPVSLKRNKLMNRPSSWDLNYDDTALEVVDKKGRPIFQLYYDSPSHLVMSGVFAASGQYTPVIAHDED